ncbi:P-loop containing nucleoside triphosphate hydrolase protein [Mycena metata]|uniref:P-loop containing nucleoside triphosphate hydrolase protein n=1 Tax=Mycena metata TaxID=1033252 RepID=A0AAD7H551_9AGAR|nr:P-loop containing nucleoside triphosphate hydrolase protein [Mycena metata]
MLPAIPKIFHGRELELVHIIKALGQDSCRIAILGAGGMGKTSLANAVLHHPKITDKYQSHFFVACDSATNCIELAALIGSHLGLQPGKNLKKPVVRYFSSNPPCLLVLDNMETPWEQVDSRPRVEAFLALLAAIPHLALIITMRGAERPAQVQWSHPFLPPLGPLPTDAARQTFMDITDRVDNMQDMDKLLLLTDNMPLAVNLIAHLVDYDGCYHVLNRWETEKTSLLSVRYDKKSNLNASIMLSLSSSRMTSLPGAKELLSLLSILPDGLSDFELLQSDLPIANILACKAALLRISLAYTDHKMRLRSLVPIREYMQQLHPPSLHLVQAIYKHFHLLLDFYDRYQGSTSAAKAVDNITSNLGNIQSVLLQRLQNNSSDLADTIHCTILLNRFSRITGRGCTTLMDRIPTVLPKPIDHRVEAAFITEAFASRTYYPIVDPEALFHQGQAHFHEFHDPVLECEFYFTVVSTAVANPEHRN